MSEHITVRGFVATDPSTRTTPSGLAVGNFRLASTDRRFDREQQAWVDGATNWFTVNMFRQLSTNVAASLSKGQPVLVTGRLKVRQWQNGERAGTSVEIEAETIGHDLTLGTAFFNRAVGRTAPADSVPADSIPGGGVISEEPEGEVNRLTGELLSGSEIEESELDGTELGSELESDLESEREGEAESLSAA